MAYDSRLYASPHFSWREFACHNWQRTAYPMDWREERGRPLAEELEKIRSRLSQLRGKDTPLYLNSVYRTVEWNREVGGRPRSRHLEGEAADLCCPHGCTYTMFRQAVMDTLMRTDCRIRYVKFYPHQGFIHVDIRQAPSIQIEEDAPV